MTPNTWHPMFWMAAVRGRWRALLQRDAMETDFSEEIRFHLEMETQTNIDAGMSPSEARRRAMIAFGGVEQMRERHRDARGARLIEDVIADIRYAGRSLRKHGGYAVAVALTMMLGIGANVAVFSVAYGVLLRPLPYSEANRLVRVWSRNDARNLPFFSVSPADLGAWRERSRVFAATGAFERQRPATMMRSGEPQLIDVAAVTSDVFALLGTNAMLGRGLVESDASPAPAPVAVMAFELWATEFGSDSSVVGSSVVLDNRQYTVVGIMPRRFTVPGTPAEIWTPLSLAGVSLDHSQRYLRVLGRLAPGVTIADANRKLDDVAAQLGRDMPESNGSWRVNMMTIPELVVGPEWRRAVLVLTGVVSCVLLIACANAANLQLTRGASRRREVAVRIALGAARGRIVRQLLTESVLLATVGGLAGVALAYVGLAVLRGAGADTLPRIEDVRIDGLVLVFAVLVTFASGLLFGILPAIGASQGRVGDTLREGGRSGHQQNIGRRARAGLVVAQVALSLVLLVGAGLLMRSLTRLQRIDIGFDPSNVQIAGFRLHEAQYPDSGRTSDFYARLLERVTKLPGVQNAALVSSAPFSGPNSGIGFALPEHTPLAGEVGPDADVRYISPGYFRTMRISLLRGRDFNAQDRAGSIDAVIISEMAANRYWAGTDPLGREIETRVGGAPRRFTIVGVVRDARYIDVQNPDVRPMLYFPSFTLPQRAMTLVAKTDNPTVYTSALRAGVRTIEPALPVGNVTALRERVADVFATQRFALILFGLFAVIALLLATIGIYGVVSYVVRQRTHEMGVRVALGATSGALVRKVVGDAMRLTMAGVISGVVAAWFLTRSLGALLFDVSPTDAATFIGVSGVLLVTATVASLAPARRAGRVDPTVALRADG